MSAVGDSLLDPCFHFFGYPRHSAGTKRYPFREPAFAFKSRNVARMIWDAID